MMFIYNSLLEKSYFCKQKIINIMITNQLIHFFSRQLFVAFVLFFSVDLQAQDYDLPSFLSGTSGIISYNGNLITMNDHSDSNLYVIDTLGNGLRSINTHLAFVDCEEISQDILYIYLGDFGNNSSGNRQNLRIFRIPKAEIDANNVTNVDTITFSYSNQSDFAPLQVNQTDFDCEAMIVTDSSIYLFSKQWHRKQTALYRLDKQVGAHVAEFMDQYNIAGLVTGATYLQEQGEVFLVGYSTLLEPFYVRLSSFVTDSFFSGSVEKCSIALPFCQMEAIARQNGYVFYTTNENVSRNGVNVPQRLHRMDLSFYSANSIIENINENVYIYPVPIKNYMIIRGLGITNIRLYNVNGRQVYYSMLTKGAYEHRLDVHFLTKGEYFVVFETEKGDFFTQNITIVP